jgi:hypothetical protein
MRVPQVSERIKEAPAQALRGVFAGIGQLLLITDKLRNKTPAGQDVPRGRTPEAAGDGGVTSPAEETSALATEPAVAEPAATEPAVAEPAASTAPAEAVTAPAEAAAAQEAAAAEPADETAPKPPKRQSARDFDKTGNVRLLDGEAGGSGLDAAAPAAVSAPEPAAVPEPVSAAEPVAAPVSAADEAPLPNYDELSVASLRARLRNLDVTQVRKLADYERAHAARADVLTMFERRVAKLEADA